MFIVPRNIARVVSCAPGHLSAEVASSLNYFVQRGWLEPVPPEQVFATQHRLADLKLMARRRGLPVSGSRTQLVSRLAAQSPDLLCASTEASTKWRISSGIAGRVRRPSE
ncbi:SAP domain-containing protein [Xanthomonas campestris]|uniref:SAP domain-containing protein n=1 Tax=Xanthomonas campestris TaxID=339 RepID=UPI003D06F672